MLEKRKFAQLTLGIVLGLSLGLTSCSQEDLSAELVAEQIWHNCLTRERWTEEKATWCAKRELLRNAEYKVSDFGVIQLTDGVYEDPAEQVLITLIDDPGAIVYGDLADGVGVALALLRIESAGTGLFFHLAALVEEGDSFTNVATVILGDRVIVKSVALNAGLIRANLIKHGPTDPQCCPTLEVVQTYELQGEELTLLSEEEMDVESAGSDAQSKSN